MHKPLLLTGALVVSAAVHALAQTTDPTDNTQAPFVRNTRPDRPGQTVTTSMLRPGQFGLEVGIERQLPTGKPGGTLSSSLLRIGFFNHMELRITQHYQHPLPARLGDDPAPAIGGWLPLTVGAKWLASTNQDARSQVVLLTELTLPNTGNKTLNINKSVAAARLLASQQLGQRFGLEGNLGFRQSGFRAADTKQGRFLYTLALNGPLGKRFGFFAEGYGTGRASFAHGTTLGLNWRPLPGLRLDVTAGRALTGPGGTTFGGGLSVRLPR